MLALSTKAPKSVQADGRESFLPRDALAMPPSQSVLRLPAVLSFLYTTCRTLLNNLNTWKQRQWDMCRRRRW